MKFLVAVVFSHIWFSTLLLFFNVEPDELSVEAMVDDCKSVSAYRTVSVSVQVELVSPMFTSVLSVGVFTLHA